jgi:hypothetical protein
MELGIEPGDRIVGVNGAALLDALDFQFHAADRNVIPRTLSAPGSSLRYQLSSTGDEYCVTFDDPTFDGVRPLLRRLPFLLHQADPEGCRRSLYVMGRRLSATRCSTAARHPGPKPV